jgi:uncharacterized repeat protein (TIGR03803 family)
MNTVDIARYVLGGFAVTAVLAGCGGLQSPLATSNEMAQVNRATSSSFQVLHRFGREAKGGALPLAPLLNVNGMLYGTTRWSNRCEKNHCGNGTVFSITTGGLKKVLYKFKGGLSDGADPIGGLINVNGTLYGTTFAGGGSGCGGSGCGTVYSLSTSGAERVVYSFKGGSDGDGPTTSLIDVDGTLYGTTVHGGQTGYGCGGTDSIFTCGTIYSIDPSGSEKVIYSFASIPDGAEPDTPLIDVNGTLYGTTAGGGVACGTKTITFTAGCGTVYSISTSGSENVLYRFKGSNLAAVVPTGGLVDVNGSLYGTTANLFARGSVYKVSLTGNYKVLYYFQGLPDGSQPIGGLVSINGILYGTTQLGGTGCESSTHFECGTVFSVTTNGSETVLHSFTGRAHGAYPRSVIGVNGTLYGTTTGGGYSGCSEGCGTVFALTPQPKAWK